MNAPTFEPAAAAIAARMASAHLPHAAARMALIIDHLQSLPKTTAHTIRAAAFIQRIPSDVWGKVKAACQGSTTLAVALDQGIAQLCASAVIVADDPQLMAMLAQLVTAGVITEAERTQILSF